MNGILKIENVNRIYIDGDDPLTAEKTEALQNINLTVTEGEFLSIIGSSGCGKTTLLRLIGGLDRPQSGTLIFDGHEITRPDPERGYIFQQGSLFPWMTVEENIAVGLKARHVYKQEKDKVPYYIEMIGLKGFERSYPHQISGGMAQRVAIARALINSPRMLLLDEPMGALDSFTRADIQDRLLEIHSRERITMVLVTHDVEEAIYLSDRIVIMTPRPGRISEVLDIDLKFPRNRGDEGFLKIRTEIMERFHLASKPAEPEYMI
ncbi:MAG: ABC transporter ATP-binding protein [Lachnospiraceae bacterium]|nr:ABC transporter ATP-binding protein [Lachnospiraceae bacterium]